MKRKSRMNPMAAFLAAVILITLCLSQAVFAQESAEIDLEKPVSLTVDLNTPDKNAQDKYATISIYSVGEWDGSTGKYALTEVLKASGAEIDSIGDDTSKLKEVIDQLENYVKAHNLEAIETKTTSAGKLEFTGLKIGMYLISQTKGEEDNVTVTPFLITLPALDSETYNWLYDVNTYPKYEDNTTPSPTPPEPTPSRGGRRGGNSTSEGSGDGLTIINDPGVPLDAGDDPGLFTVLEDLVPLGDLPQTGDTTCLAFGLILMVISAGMLVSLITYRKYMDAGDGGRR